jgi:hypothetical protein
MNAILTYGTMVLFIIGVFTATAGHRHALNRQARAIQI